MRRKLSKRNRSILWDINKAREYIENEIFELYQLKVLSIVCQGKADKLDLVDNEDFLYKLSVADLQKNKKRGSSLCKVGKGNPHSLENIKNLLKREDIPEKMQGLTLLSEEYVSATNNLTWLCRNGHKIENSWNHFQSGRGCGICYGKRLSSTEEFKEHVVSITENKYEVLSKYINARTKIKMKHRECGHIYSVIPDSFSRGTRCPKCNESKGERRVSEFLTTKKLCFSSQEKFDECLSIRELPFDFFVCEALLVEYDGEDHFYPIDRARRGADWAKESHQYRVENDKIKNQYCINSNIPLLRIPYWEFNNIEDILESALMHYNIIEKNDSYDVNKFMHYIVDKNWDHDVYTAKCPKNQKELVNNMK